MKKSILKIRIFFLKARIAIEILFLKIVIFFSGNKKGE
jgi:hypothetical protein